MYFEVLWVMECLWGHDGGWLLVGDRMSCLAPAFGVLLLLVGLLV